MLFSDKPVNAELNDSAGLECCWNLVAALARAYIAWDLFKTVCKKTPEKVLEGFFNTSWVVQQPAVTVCLGDGLISKMDKCMLGLSAVVKSSL